MQLYSFLFKPADNTSLVIWRVIFGLLLLIKTVGAIAVGWVKQVFINPPLFTLNFIGFEWLLPLPGNDMYVWFGVLGLLSLAIILGYRYTLSMVLFTLGWCGVYFMHKTSYNNHHYLKALVCFMMCFVPANRAYSIDVKLKRVKPLSYCYNYFLQNFVLLLLIVFVYASVAKMYPDWLQGTPLSQWLADKRSSSIGFLYTSEYQGVIMSWGGILFDLLIIPALIWRPTRNIAFGISIAFHLMNSITFQIGTFPYMMIGASALFYPAEKLRKLFKLKTRHPFATSKCKCPQANHRKFCCVLYISNHTSIATLPYTRQCILDRGRAQAQLANDAA